MEKENGNTLKKKNVSKKDFLKFIFNWDQFKQF